MPCPTPQPRLLPLSHAWPSQNFKIIPQNPELGIYRKKELSKPISRVLFPDEFRAVTIHLALMLPPRSSDLPRDRAGRPITLYSVLLWVGFAQPASHLAAGELLPHHFTLARTGYLSQPLAVCFCGTFRRVTPPGRYPAPCPVELGLSSLIFANQSGHLVYLAPYPLYTQADKPSNLSLPSQICLERCPS